jgi:hypothetical protein
MGEKKVNDLAATLTLKAAMRMNKIDLTDDPLYPRLQDAEWELLISKRCIQAFALVSNASILYFFRFKDRLPWMNTIGRCSIMLSICTLAYYTCPGFRKYNETLIQISKRKKDYLADIYPDLIKKE